MHSNLKETSRNSNAIAWNHRWWHSETTKEARGETQKKCWLLQKRFKANHNQIPQWASWWNQVVKGKSMILPWQSARLLKNTQSKMPRTQIVVLGYTQCKMPRPWRHTHTQHNAEKKIGARYSHCSADAVFQQWGTSGTAPRKVFYKLLCRWTTGPWPERKGL